MDKTNVTNTNLLFEALQDTWESMNERHLQNFVESMPRRLEAVVSVKGGYTKYWA